LGRVKGQKMKENYIGFGGVPKAEPRTEKKRKFWVPVEIGEKRETRKKYA